MANYQINTGMNYKVNGIEVRAEIGDVVSNIPTRDIEWLLSEGHVSVKAEEPIVEEVKESE